MLSIKTTLSEKVSLPTIIFDEIDTGVSGEIAHKMGNIMQLLARNMQIISITHLPQIASKGHEQFTVEKRLTNNITKTTIRKLSTDERITEIAKLLSGSEITNASIENAKVLLNS
jgi:DNA repair protein RecN (Recombination protein N)